MAEAHRWAERFVALPPAHVQRTKALMTAMRVLPDRDMLARELETRRILSELDDSREAVEAWAERRTPRYTGSEGLGDGRTARRRSRPGLHVGDLGPAVLADPGRLRRRGDQGRVDPSPGRPALPRATPGSDPASIERSGLWNNLNRNKRSITLNMRHPDGVDLALRLIEHCDVVLENFSPGVLESWGLSWAAMTARRPGLVHVSMSGFGWDGPNAHYVVFAPVMQALSGLHAMTSRPAGEPTGLGFSYGDHVGGYYAALATLAALHERDASGEGAIIDLAQVEGTITLTSTAILDYQLSGRPFVAWGNVPFGSLDAPAGLYRCDGDDAWCADLGAHQRGVVRLDRRDGRRRSWRATAASPIGPAGPPIAGSSIRPSPPGRRGCPRDEVVRRLRDAGVPCTPLSTRRRAVGRRAATEPRLLRGRGPSRAGPEGVPDGWHPLRARLRSAPGGAAHRRGERGGLRRLLGLSAEEIQALSDEAVI